MTDRLSRQRWWIACLYCLAAVLAQGFHTHHAPSGLASRAAETRCHSEHPEELRAGDGVALSCANDCPSCEFSLIHQAPLDDPAIESETVRLVPAPPPSPTDRDASPVRPRGRAPPVA